MNQQQNIAAAHARLIQAINAVNGRVGDLTTLKTVTKASVVAAVNELQAALANITAVQTAVIDDSTTSASKTWSSTKINNSIMQAVTTLLGGADANNDTFKELADRINALLQADAGLVSFMAAQTLTAAQQKQVGDNIGIGDPNWDYVPAISAALNSGL